MTLRDGSPKFTCPACGESVSKVVGCDFKQETETYERTRECLACRMRFPTGETLDETRWRRWQATKRLRDSHI